MGRENKKWEEIGKSAEKEKRREVEKRKTGEKYREGEGMEKSVVEKKEGRRRKWEKKGETKRNRKVNGRSKEGR